MPADRPVKFPDDCDVPPLILKVKFELPDADAEILPLFCPAPDVFVTVPLTVIVTPLQGFVGPPPPPLLLLHDMYITIKADRHASSNDFLISNFKN